MRRALSRADILSRSTDPRRIVPRDIGITPVIARISVDLPAPFGPTSPTIPGLGRVRLRSGITGWLL